MEFTLTRQTADSIDPRSVRRILGLFATGITVITSVGAEGEWVGKTVNSFTSVSLTPPLVLFCVHYRSPMLEVLRDRRVFAVSILEEDQETISRTFAGSGAARFHEISCSAGLTGAPILQDALGFLECHVVCEYDGGDHAIVLGQVARTGKLRGDRPLAFFNSTHTRLGS